MMTKKCELTKTKMDIHTMMRLKDGGTITYRMYADLCYELAKGNFTLKEAKEEYDFQQKFYKETKSYLGMVKRYAMYHSIPEDTALQKFTESEKRYAEDIYKKDVSCLTKEEALAVQYMLKKEFITDEVRKEKIRKEGGKVSLDNFDTYWDLHGFAWNSFAYA